jgi:periplasmic divalent cation tolerance protein
MTGVDDEEASAGPAPEGFALVLCTAPPDRAEELAERLLDERLVACVNLIGPLVSRYRWNGALERADEVLLLMKTRRDRVAALTARIVALHPYEVPEVLELGITGGLPAYLAWIDASCRG